MKLNELRDKEGATHSGKRVGRGIGSGKGKTGGRGVKGQKSRSGVAINGFEGGQMPLYRRLPKRGFNNIFAKSFVTVSLARIQAAIDAKKLDAKETVTAENLAKAGVIRRVKDGVRILSDGELKAKLSFDVAGASKAAVDNLTRSLARALAPGIRVVSVSPGLVDTEFVRGLDESWRNQQAERTPLKRLALPAEVAEAVVAVALHLPFTTGSIIPVDGGRPLA